MSRRSIAAFYTLLCFFLGGVYLFDLIFWRDGAGFAIVGPAWARYVVWLAVAALFYLPARRAAAQPMALSGICPALGVTLLLCGSVLGVSGSLEIYSLLPYLKMNPPTAPPLSGLLDALALPAGLWLLWQGFRCFSGFGIKEGRLGHPVWTLPMLIYFTWRMVFQFQVAPASVLRLPCTLQLLAAASALLFVSLLCKVFLTPGLPCGHTLFAAGMGAFWLCTCLLLPQTIVGSATLLEFLQGLSMGLLGLNGLVCAWCAMGRDATDEI